MPGQQRPIGAHGFQTFVDHFIAAVGAGDEAGVAFLAALLGTANGRHQEAFVVNFELQFESAFQAIFIAHMRAPPVVDVLDQCMTDVRRLFLPVRTTQPDES
ncbi:hypothetical protein D3C72_1509220 [compost metagenome]